MKNLESENKFVSQNLQKNKNQLLNQLVDLKKSNKQKEDENKSILM